MNFYSKLIEELLVDSRNSFSYIDNYDEIRFGEIAVIPLTIKGKIRKKLEKIFNNRGYEITKKEDVIKYIGEKIGIIDPYLSDLEDLYDLLSNEESKILLVKILAFRVLGFTKVKLPLNTPEFWAGIKEIEELTDKNTFIKASFFNWELPLVNLNKKGIPIQLYFLPMGAYIDFIFKQYEYGHNFKYIKAEKGDFVIDAGGCWGDTALYFANEVGNSGRVFTYEFIPSNLEIMTKNIALNPNLEQRITVIKHPVWETSDRTMFYIDNGPGSRVFMNGDEKYDGKVESISIDDLVNRLNINKVNFIKMDIEGAEPAALKGAMNVIKKFKPKLAIAIYHSLDDFVNIPKFIHDLGLGYKLYLSHCSIHEEETILFAEISN
ncbi:MAG TPA: FkbM family methyltransferase [Puia sp.]|nr:FkbM family methyltransferase [Puia sp.]